jgi:hypothetical protein
VHLLNPKPTHPPADFFSSFFGRFAFGRFSVRGVQKHHEHVFAKSQCRKPFRKKSTKISMAVFPRFLSIVFSGVSQRREFKNTTKHVLQSSRKKFLQKIMTNNPKPIFLSICLNHVFRRFSVRGVRKHRKNIEK